MATSTIDIITLSGNVASSRYAAVAGDVYLYRKDDRQGANYRSGRQALLNKSNFC